MNLPSLIVDKQNLFYSQIHTEFRQECSKVTIEGLLEQFVRHKATGNDKPSNPFTDLDILKLMSLENIMIASLFCR